MSTSKNEETVKVMVRIRPMNRSEKEKGKKLKLLFNRKHFSGEHGPSNKKCVHR